MKGIWQAFLSLFLKPFQLAEEYRQTNLIRSIGKDKNGYAVIDVITVGSRRACELYPHQIMEKPFLRNQFRATDINVIKAALIAEGDIFIESKEYRENTEIFFLRSKVDEGEWMMTGEQLGSDKAIFHRINKRFLSQDICVNLVRG
jgi:hypothetical protein